MTQAFNLSQFANFVNTSGKADLTTAVTGVLPVANGGSGAATFSSGSVLLGSGTSSFGTVAPGATGNLLTSNGTTWTSAAAPLTGQNVVVYNATGTWTVPAGVTKAIIELWGGGGGGAKFSISPFTAWYGGAGGYIKVFLTGLTGSYSIVIGAGGSGGLNDTATSGAASTFGGTIIVANGGTRGSSVSGNGTNGTTSYTAGTALRQNSAQYIQGSLGGLGQSNITTSTWSISSQYSPGAYGNAISGSGGAYYNGLDGACVITY